MKDLLVVGRDLTLAGAVLYVTGLTSSLFYYSRFGIFSLDIIRPQCILIATFIALLYYGLPWAIIGFSARLLPRRLQSIVGLTVLLLADLFLVYFLRRDFTLLTFSSVATGILLQAALLFRRYSRGSLFINPVLSSGRFLIVLPLLALHYALFIHSWVPGYFGGGKPITVVVYAEPQNLPADRFAQSKNRNRANKFIDSYRLHLLYETTQDYYFIEERRSAHGLEGFAIARLPKHKIIRMDYLTPSWVSMKGIDW